MNIFQKIKNIFTKKDKEKLVGIYPKLPDEYYQEAESENRKERPTYISHLLEFMKKTENDIKKEKKLKFYKK